MNSLGWLIGLEPTTTGITILAIAPYAAMVSRECTGIFIKSQPLIPLGFSRLAPRFSGALARSMAVRESLRRPFRQPRMAAAWLALIRAIFTFVGKMHG